MVSEITETSKVTAIVALVLLIPSLSLIGCHRSVGDPSQLIRDISQSGLNLGKPLVFDQKFQYEKAENTALDKYFMTVYTLANGALSVNESGILVGVSLNNPDYGGLREELSVLSPMSFTGVNLLSASADEITTAYGPPSKVDSYADGEVQLTALVYYYRAPGPSLVEVDFSFFDDNRKEVVDSIRIWLSKQAYALDIVNLGKYPVFDWPQNKAVE